jgi:4-amino-4-deoxy-L-arabinose transferase-like glycosyltransferase
MKLPQPKLHGIRYSLLITMLVFAAGLSLRLWRLTYVTLWSDEFRGTLQLIQYSWRDLVTGNYPWDLNPPLYFLVLKGWITFLGSDNEPVMRSLSIFASCVSMVIIYLLGKRLGNERVGLALLLVLAFHPEYLFYSTDLRMYSVLVLLSLMTCYFYLEYLLDDHHSRWWLLAMSISLALACYTHYFGVLIGLGIMMAAIFIHFKRKDKLGSTIWFMALSAIFAIPLMLIFLQQYFRYVNNWVNPEVSIPKLDVASLIALFAGSASFDFSVTDLAQVLSLLAVISGLVILFRNDRKITAFALCAFVGVAWLSLFLISVRIVGIHPRYLIPIFLVPWVIIAMSWIETTDSYSKLLRIFSIAAIGTIMLSGISSTVNKEYPSPNWRDIAERLVLEAEENEQIVIMGWDASPTGYYLDRSWMTSYDLEMQVVEGKTDSYLILDSVYSRKLEFIDYSKVIYEDPGHSVRIIRFVPQK